MTKSQVPRGATKKVKCKCGMFFHPRLIGSSLKLTKECSVCDPASYKEEENK